jgi:hypothetical protein
MKKYIYLIATINFLFTLQSKAQCIATCNSISSVLGNPSCTSAGMNLNGSSNALGQGGSVLCGTSFPATYPAQTTAGGSCADGGGGTGTTYDCLISQPNPSWFAIQTGATGGSLCLDMTNSNNLDIDFAMYGPIPTCGATSFQANCLGAPIDCDFTIAEGGQINVASALPNSTYYVLVTNYDGTVTNITINNCAVPGTASLACPAQVVLPLLYDYFNGKVLTTGNLLKWRTLTETNSSHFNIQKSNDGVEFYTIKSIYSNAKNGNSQQPLLDQKIKIGSTFYRIEQVDIDNKMSYSKSIELINYNSGGITIYPNPALNEVNVVLNNINLDVKTNIEITDIYGKVIEKVSAINNSNNNKLKINISSLTKGIYFIKIYQNGKEVLVNKLVK